MNSTKERVEVSNFADDADRLLEESEHVSRDAPPFCNVVRLAHQLSRQIFLVQRRHQLILPSGAAERIRVTKQVQKEGVSNLRVIHMIRHFHLSNLVTRAAALHH